MEITRIPEKKNPAVVLLQLLVICVPLYARHRPSDARFVQFENSGEYVANNRIDTLVMKTFRNKGIEPANLCSDAVFIRRVYLDVIGTLPEPQEVRKFLQDRSPRKRATLIHALLRRDEFADYWSLK